jgi:transposase
MYRATPNGNGLHLNFQGRSVIRDAAETTIVGLWKGCCGWLCRDLPDEFGKWYTVYTRFWRWAQKDVLERIFKHLSEDPDFEYVLIDATF